jgi:hypothetical protein
MCWCEQALTEVVQGAGAIRIISLLVRRHTTKERTDYPNTSYVLYVA